MSGDSTGIIPIGAKPNIYSKAIELVSGTNRGKDAGVVGKNCPREVRREIRLS